jgi:hypothetical protein
VSAITILKTETIPLSTKNFFTTFFCLFRQIGPSSSATAEPRGKTFFKRLKLCLQKIAVAANFLSQFAAKKGGDAD